MRSCGRCREGRMLSQRADTGSLLGKREYPSMIDGNPYGVVHSRTKEDASTPSLSEVSRPPAPWVGSVRQGSAQTFISADHARCPMPDADRAASTGDPSDSFRWLHPETVKRPRIQKQARKSRMFRYVAPTPADQSSPGSLRCGDRAEPGDSGTPASRSPHLCLGVRS